MLLGTLFTFDKMSKDSEITILELSECLFRELLHLVVVLSVIFTFLCFLTGDKGTPTAAAKIMAIKGSIRSTQYIYTQKDETGHPLAACYCVKIL